MKLPSLNKIYLVAALAALTLPREAAALALDWSGYFRADHNVVSNYQMHAGPGYANSGNTTNDDNGLTGEWIRGQGGKSAIFSSYYLRLKPRVLVNDNVIVRSEWNVGDPVAGFFGRGIPREDRNNPLSTQKAAMDLTVARLWLDVHTDFGTLQVGRAPFQWGLGVIFNSADGPFDRFQSTSDTIRVVSKFGYLSLMPLYAKNATGDNLAGARNPATGAVARRSDDVTDYGIGLRYENPEEDLDAGFLFYKRNADESQTSYFRPGNTAFAAGANGMNLKLLNFYGKKSWNRLQLGAEVPLFRGDIPDSTGSGSRSRFSATAVAVEAALKYETWKHSLKLGTVPGQAAASTGNRGSDFGALYFHRSYKLGQILFNYNLGNFGNTNPDAVPPGTSPNAAVSPYDASITNAKYLMLATEKRWEQWGLNLGVVWAQANESAQRGKDFFNHRTRQWYTAQGTQGKNLGLEVDLGARYNWDDNISFGADFGVLFPGNYYKFINSSTRELDTSKVMAFSVSAATVF